MNGQISIAEYLREKNRVPAAHCGSCICQSCLYWWSNRCPNSDCYLGRRPQVYGCQEGVVYPCLLYTSTVNPSVSTTTVKVDGVCVTWNGTLVESVPTSVEDENV